MAAGLLILVLFAVLGRPTVELVAPGGTAWSASGDAALVSLARDVIVASTPPVMSGPSRTRLARDLAAAGRLGNPPGLRAAARWRAALTDLHAALAGSPADPATLGDLRLGGLELTAVVAAGA